MYRFANIFKRIPMKKFFTLLVAFSSIVFAANAQTTEVVNVDTPEITFKSTEVDYGVVPQNSDGTRKIEFTNTGKQPLLLTNVAASCGCTVVEWAKEPIKPGEKGSLAVKYNTVIVGPFNKSIRVFSNAKSSPVFITIKGEVKPLQESTSQTQQ